MNESRKQQVSLRGASAKEITRYALIERVNQERELRNYTRRANAAVLFIQRVWRRYYEMRMVSVGLRREWEIMMSSCGGARPGTWISSEVLRNGLFSQTSTSDRLLIPNATARFLDNGIQIIEFLGRIVGKALYEGILLDFYFSHVFVQKLLGRYSFLAELSTLDPELYRNLMYVKHYEGDVNDLSLDFTVTEESLGKRHVIELKLGGKDVCVTNENKLQYVHAMTDYKLNRQILSFSNAFYRGLTDLISPSWLKLFNSSEFNQEEYTMLVPPWLENLLNTATFFNLCRIHSAAARSECNMFCLDCNVDAFCLYCRSSKHEDHRVIQIRRSSYHDVVRVLEIEKALDISGVQTYVINSARVLFLNERPQPKGGKAVSRVCEICGRSLLDTFRFCSLGCKLIGIKTNGDASFCLDAKDEALIQRGISRRENHNMSSSSSREEEEFGEGSQEDNVYPTASPSGRRRKKGIPQRAPFGCI